MPTAILFPGQGSQDPDMRGLAAAEAPDLLERCLELVGDDPFARVADRTRFAPSPPAANSRRFAQPAFFCASVAGWQPARDVVGPPAAAAGHSLGEFAAL